jgi:hypothetical protein
MLWFYKSVTVIGFSPNDCWENCFCGNMPHSYSSSTFWSWLQIGNRGERDAFQGVPQPSQEYTRMFSCRWSSLLFTWWAGNALLLNCLSVIEKLSNRVDDSPLHHHSFTACEDQSVPAVSLLGLYSVKVGLIWILITLRSQYFKLPGQHTSINLHHVTQVRFLYFFLLFSCIVCWHLALCSGWESHELFLVYELVIWINYPFK